MLYSHVCDSGNGGVYTDRRVHTVSKCFMVVWTAGPGPGAPMEHRSEHVPCLPRHLSTQFLVLEHRTALRAPGSTMELHTAVLHRAPPCSRAPALQVQRSRGPKLYRRGRRTTMYTMRSACNLTAAFPHACFCRNAKNKFLHSAKLHALPIGTL